MSPVSARIVTDADSRLITCILPKGAGKPLLEAIHNYGVTTANMYFARGSDAGDPFDRNGLPVQVQKEIVTLVVPKKDAEKMFEFVIEYGQINRPGGGVAYQGKLDQSVPFVLPDLPDPSQPEVPHGYEMSVKAETEARLITCVLPKGAGKPVLEALHNRGVTTANLCFARGSIIGDPVDKNGLQPQDEKEIVMVITSKKEADEIFAFVAETAQVDRPGGGIVYMGELRKSVPFVLPDLPAPS